MDESPSNWTLATQNLQWYIEQVRRNKSPRCSCGLVFRQPEVLVAHAERENHQLVKKDYDNGSFPG